MFPSYITRVYFDFLSSFYGFNMCSDIKCGSTRCNDKFPSYTPWASQLTLGFESIRFYSDWNLSN